MRRQSREHQPTSRPARGAWIETHPRRGLRMGQPGMRPARGAWIETWSTSEMGFVVQSRPARGAWIETCWSGCPRVVPWSRVARGARGLKLGVFPRRTGKVKSRPRAGRGIETAAMLLTSIPASRVRAGAWIETNRYACSPEKFICRVPRGARGLKPALGLGIFRPIPRAPRGARGLKPGCWSGRTGHGVVASRAGAWIETRMIKPEFWDDEKSRPARGARGLKREESGLLAGAKCVAPARGAWIETRPRKPEQDKPGVASRAGAWIET